MSTESGLLHAIREKPEEDTPRLIYADWLDENEQPERAEFIRLQCRLANLDEYDPERPHLEWRERVLLRKHKKAWGKAVAKYTSRFAFHRGFIDEIAITAAKFLENADTLFSITPLEQLRPLQVGARWNEFLASPQLQRLHGLDLNCSSLGTTRGQVLGACEQLEDLHELNIDKNRLRPAGMIAILGSRHLSNLRRLFVSQNEAGDAALTAMRDNTHFTHLRDLNLASNRIGSAGATRLAQASWISNLEHLNLSDNPIGVDGLRRLADSGALAGLKRFSCPDLTAEGPRILASCPHLAGLTELECGSAALGENVLAELARSDTLSRLRVLRMRSNLTEADADALIHSPIAPNLRVLHLHTQSPAAAKTLFTAQSLSNLTHLRLRYSGSDVIDLLWQSPYLSNLRELDIACCWLDDKTIKSLSNCENFRQLTVLDISHNYVELEGLQSLVKSPHLNQLRRLRYGNAGRTYDKLESEVKLQLEARFGEDVCEYVSR
jgi:uncharacterized protein (TIGR02996 family)